MTSPALKRWEEVSKSQRFDGLPIMENLASIKKPEISLPSSHLSPHELTDVQLSQHMYTYSLWESWAIQAAGLWRAEEAILDQQMSSVKRFKYMEKFEKGKTQSRMEAEIGTDDEVLELDMEMAIVKKNVKAFEQQARSYGRMSMNYAGERKHREVAPGYDPERTKDRNGTIDWGR